MRCDAVFQALKPSLELQTHYLIGLLQLSQPSNNMSLDVRFCTFSTLWSFLQWLWLWARWRFWMLLWLGPAIVAILNAFPLVLMFGVADAVDVVRVSCRIWMEMIVFFVVVGWVLSGWCMRVDVIGRWTSSNCALKLGFVLRQEGISWYES